MTEQKKDIREILKARREQLDARLVVYKKLKEDSPDQEIDAFMDDLLGISESLNDLYGDILELEDGFAELESSFADLLGD